MLPIKRSTRLPWCWVSAFHLWTMLAVLLLNLLLSLCFRYTVTERLGPFRLNSPMRVDYLLPALACAAFVMGVVPLFPTPKLHRSARLMRADLAWLLVALALSCASNMGALGSPQLSFAALTRTTLVYCAVATALTAIGFDELAVLLPLFYVIFALFFGDAGSLWWFLLANKVSIAHVGAAVTSFIASSILYVRHARYRLGLR